MAQNKWPKFVVTATPDVYDAISKRKDLTFKRKHAGSKITGRLMPYHEWKNDINRRSMNKPYFTEDQWQGQLKYNKRWLSDEIKMIKNSCQEFSDYVESRSNKN